MPGVERLGAHQEAAVWAQVSERWELVARLSEAALRPGELAGARRLARLAVARLDHRIPKAMARPVPETPPSTRVA